jgi:hypothetical protein
MRLSACVLLPFVYFCVLWLMKCNCLNPQRTKRYTKKSAVLIFSVPTKTY